MIRSVVVTHNGKKYDLDVDITDSAEVLQLQLYTLTRVPPGDQKVLGLVKGGALKGDTDLAFLNIKDGHKIILMGKPEDPSSTTPLTSAEAITTTSSTPSASISAAAQYTPPVDIQQTIFEEDITAWRTECSRIFFPKEDIKQPCFMFSSFPVCYACSTTCYLPSQVVPKKDFTNPFRCKCAEISGKECLYATRSLSAVEEVSGKLKGLIIEDIEKVNKMFAAPPQQQQNQQQQTIAMANRLNGTYNHVLMYEKHDLQEQARAVIPREVQVLAGKEQVVELLHWFKQRFFSWVNQPPCVACGGNTRSVGSSPPTAEEQRWQAHNVELYTCDTCQAFTRFPRYNHPAKLLETRKGRCGEWANCFTLCCRALHIDARYILDFTDHVWTEVYDEETHRWVHCDSCEDSYDAPMTYEAGWGKKLSYVFAFAWDHISDVSKRYSRKWAEMCERRNMISEENLAGLITNFNAKIFTTISPLRKNITAKRLTEEKDEVEHLVKGDVPTFLRPDELQGRQSGSVEWRSQRGEMGSGSSGGGVCAVPVARKQPPPTPLLTHSHRVLTADPPHTSPDDHKFVFVGCGKFSSPSTTTSSLQITPNATSQRGGVWLRDMVKIDKGFTVRLQLKMTSRGADGMAFVLHKSPQATQALGGEGCGLGYDGILRSVAVEFDTWQTADRCADPSGNHISVHTRGMLANSSHHSHSLACAESPSALNDGAEHTAIIQYNAEKHTLDVWFDSKPVLEAEIDIVELLNLKDDKCVWMGVVGATGGLAQLQEVLAWVIDIDE